MMTSPAAESVSAVITASAVTAALITSLFLASVRTSCAADAAAAYRHRNASSTDALSRIPMPLSSPNASSSPSLREKENLFLVEWQQQQLLQRKARKTDDPSRTKDSQKIACYQCIYMADHDVTTNAECNDPFQTGSRVMCDGSCYKSKKKLASESFALIRGCAKSCADTVNKNGYNRCCKTDLCNQSTSLGSAAKLVVVVCSTFLSLVLVRRHGNSFL